MSFQYGSQEVHRRPGGVHIERRVGDEFVNLGSVAPIEPGRNDLPPGCGRPAWPDPMPPQLELPPVPPEGAQRAVASRPVALVPPPNVPELLGVALDASAGWDGPRYGTGLGREDRRLGRRRFGARGDVPGWAGAGSVGRRERGEVDHEPEPAPTSDAG